MSILTKKAILAALNVGGWNARKKDEAAADVVHKHYHADKDSGNYNKALIDVKAYSWKMIVKARTALREYHYAHTLPWIHKGAQLLPAAAYLQYNSEIGVLINEYMVASFSFVNDHYVRLKAEAMRKRNGLYREEDYPMVVELLRKFYAEVNYFPVPDSGHVVVDLQNDEIDKIKASTDTMILQAVEQAQRELWVRLQKPVQSMAEALSDPERRFHDTLVENIKEIVALVPSLNLAGDTTLLAIAAEVGKTLTKVPSETLRDAKDVRAEQAAKAAALAKKMAAFIGR